MASSVPVPPRRPLFFLIGDSLTQRGAGKEGWATMLQQTYVRSADVVNRGLSGYNTKGFIEYALPTILEELQNCFKPAFITVWFGANDAALEDGRAKTQRVPLEEYTSNLIHILQEIQKSAPTAKILLISPPVVSDVQRRNIQVKAGGPSDPLDRTNEAAAQYAAACSTVVAAVDGVALLDIHAYFMETYPNPKDRTNFLCDGLHFSKVGNVTAFEKVNEKIRELLSEEVVDKWQMPDWNTVNL